MIEEKRITTGQVMRLLLCNYQDYLTSQLHNLRGPIIFIDLDFERPKWYIDGKSLTFAEWAMYAELTEEEIVLLILRYGSK